MSTSSSPHVAIDIHPPQPLNDELKQHLKKYFKSPGNMAIGEKILKEAQICTIEILKANQKAFEKGLSGVPLLLVRDKYQGIENGIATQLLLGITVEEDKTEQGK
ncbi:hypothetical protein HK104_008553, partial [Borealophlyctis nickersoniae]